MSNAVLIIDQFKNLLDTLQLVGAHIRNQLVDFPVWINNGDDKESFEHDYEKFFNALSDFYTGELETPQHTKSFQGALGGTLETLALIEQVNLHKDHLKLLIKDYLNEIKSSDTAIVRNLLKNAGFYNLKLKQVYRHIPLVDYHPRRITYTQVKHNSHIVVTKQQLAARLAKIGQGRHIDVQQNKLLNLDDDKLAIHRDSNLLWAVNVATFKNEEGLSSTKKIMTSMPMVYLHDFNLPQPQVTFSRRQNRLTNIVRADKKIEDEVFLPSAAAYRYKKHKK